MLGRLVLTESQRTVEDLSRFVPPDHAVRALDDVLDLSFVFDLARPLYSQRGRPSIDLELFLRIEILGYFLGIKSERQLCREIYTNIAYRWFCRLPLGQRLPCHSTLSKTRKRCGALITQNLFASVIQYSKNFFPELGKRVVIDSSLFEADAAIESLRANADSSGKTGKRSNATHTSVTDPDAKIVGRPTLRKDRLYYKAHLAADADSRLIIDCTLTSGNVPDNLVTQAQVQSLLIECMEPVNYTHFLTGRALHPISLSKGSQSERENTEHMA